MTTRNALGSILLVSSLAAGSGPVLAQSAAPITAAEVVGDWTLTVTPVEREGLDINFETPDGGPMVLPMTVRAGARDRLTCTLRGDPAPCRLTRVGFEAVMPTRSGAARMTFTLNRRSGPSLVGAAAVRVRFLPIGGQIGTVAMTRR